MYFYTAVLALQGSWTAERFYMWGKFPNKFHFQSESDWKIMRPFALLCWRKTWKPPQARGKLLLEKLAWAKSQLKTADQHRCHIEGGLAGNRKSCTNNSFLMTVTVACLNICQKRSA